VPERSTRKLHVAPGGLDRFAIPDELTQPLDIHPAGHPRCVGQLEVHAMSSIGVAGELVGGKVRCPTARGLRGGGKTAHGRQVIG
jgi:hypothetical protein